MADSMRSRQQPLDLSRGSTADQIRIEERAGDLMRWKFVLIWFMRLLAVFWLLKGLSAWAVILGIWSPAGPFEIRSTDYQATIVYFAVIELVAAVGLWMASAWGGVMWLLAVMSHLILAFFFPHIVSAGPLTVVFFICLVVSYLMVAWFVSREE